MKGSQRRPCALSDVRLTFCPKSITFNRAKEGSYRLYLEKNVQVISEVGETVRVKPKNPTYLFSKDNPIKPFRITSEKHTTYQISIYELQQNEEEILKDSAEFSLYKFITHYYDEFQRMDEQVKEKDRAAIAEHWRALVNNFTRKIYTKTLKFKAIDAIFEFTCLPETDYDQIVREDDALQQRRREREEAKKVGELTKSKTLPVLKLESRASNTSKRYHENDSVLTKLGSDAVLDEKDKLRVTESLKKFTIKLPEAKTPNQTEASSSNQTVSALLTKSKLTNQIFISDPIDEEPEIDPKDGAQSLRTNQKVPIVQVKNLKPFESPQIYNLSARLGNLSLNSVVNSSGKSEKKPQGNITVTWIWVLLNVMLIVYLMHPMAKY